MSLRSYMNNNPAIVTVAAIVVLLICLGLIYRSLAGGGGTAQTIDVWYYDLNTGDLFVESSDSQPPIEAPSGPFEGHPAGVRAYVFACEESGCDDPAQRKIGYLEMYTADAKAAITNPDPNAGPQEYEVIEMGRLVKAPEGGGWVPAMSNQGMMLTERISQICPNGYPKPCYPGR